MSYSSPEPVLISRQTARQFLAAAQGLRPPRRESGKSGVMKTIRNLQSLQFDPINIVGRNPDLVLQSRVGDYRPRMMDELLYEDRELWDGWDKMASLYPVEDWPYFSRYRSRMEARFGDPGEVVRELEPRITAEIRERGPLCSLDLDIPGKADWAWGTTRAARAALEGLYKMGKLGVHHRVNNRRYFDLVERLLPAPVLQAPDPYPEPEEYQKWHILRRTSSLKLAHPHAGVHWSGIEGVKTSCRRRLLTSLAAEGQVVPVRVEGVPRGEFYLRAEDLELLEPVQAGELPGPEAAVIAPLDPLLWDRQAVEWIFDFQYVWEVYKPEKDREYGYYVLPVLYGDRFIGRFEPGLDRDQGVFQVKNWWWEQGVQPSAEVKSALERCLLDFMNYLQAGDLRLSPALERKADLDWLFALAE